MGVTVNSAKFATYIRTDSWSSGDCWPIIGWHCVDRQSVDSWPISGISSTDCRCVFVTVVADLAWSIGQLSVDMWLRWNWQLIDHQLILEHLSINCSWTVDQLLIDCWSTVDRLLIDTCSMVDRQSIDRRLLAVKVHLVRLVYSLEICLWINTCCIITWYSSIDIGQCFLYTYKPGYNFWIKSGTGPKPTPTPKWNPKITLTLPPILTLALILN